MAFKRIIATVLVKDGLVVKSYGYQQWRPSGNLLTSLRNLDRWCVDEILVIDISRKEKIDNEIIKQINEANISTPLIYGGGIRNIEDVFKVLEIGVDRILLEKLVIDQNFDEIKRISEYIGEQAIIASLTLSKFKSKFIPWSYKYQNLKNNYHVDLKNLMKQINLLPISELFIIDERNEGKKSQFSLELSNLVDSLELSFSKKIIWFGGIDEVIAKELIKRKDTVAVAFGNNNYEEELFIPEIRKKIISKEKFYIREANPT